MCIRTSFLLWLNNSPFVCCSVIQLCLTLCDPMYCSMPDHPWNLLKLMSTESVMPSNHLVPAIPFSPCLLSFPASGSFLMSQIFTSGGQNVGASASSSVLPVTISDGFPLGLTDSYSMQSKGLPCESENHSIFWQVGHRGSGCDLCRRVFCLCSPLGVL